MISFYPGPSRVHREIPAYVRDAYAQGIMSINHRSDAFVDMSKRTIGLLKAKLGIPKNYTVFFTSSATECWEIIAQSLVTDKSYHLYNGSFGQKWFDYTKRIRPLAEPMPFHVNEPLDPTRLIFDLKDGLLCLTHNETSNGTQVHNRIIKAIKRNNPSYLVAVDATSSMAGVQLDFKSADIWYASVQKCFGLPAGLGILVCSPQTLERAQAIGERTHYNSLLFMMDMMEKWQTPFTPNVLSIYLLMRVMEAAPPIKEVHETTVDRYEQWRDFLKKRKTIQHFVEAEAVHSHTVVPVRAEPKVMDTIKKSARKAGLLLGEGYGDFKASSFRIANFPALTQKEVRTLMTFLQDY
ncbi:aminotransferase class V-fold PLP-dependent enzyme [Dawidia soli]|uniref:phosphoserine transaminase n=1 Tax=Dawidia soli TaxID=2782352 RepID=A0AAP2DCV3_9BACT|nr:aminotransferase class V-fold PLP-dependent enzyme [Dawidia soli]MBT1689684.1 aminotransferase class V-fold PLP-dependent enzyme [Dawidia soli]